MKSPVRAFAPGSLSCFFVIHDHEDPRWKGSTGLGFTVDTGVTVEVSKADTTTVTFNNVQIVLPPVEYVLHELQTPPVHIAITTELPLSSGFGLSGASALAAAFAINALFAFHKKNEELAIIAHTADVVSGTGLGDVASQYLGGLNVKYKPSSYFEVEKLPIRNVPVYVRSFSPLPTKSVIGNGDMKGKINKAGSAALEKIKKLQEKVSLQDIFEISKVFALESKLLQDIDVKKTIETIEDKGGHASMIMLGNAVFSDIPFEGSTKLLISDTKAHLL